MDDETTREHSRGGALSRRTERAAWRDRAHRPAHARLSAAALARMGAAVEEGMVALALLADLPDSKDQAATRRPRGRRRQGCP